MAATITERNDTQFFLLLGSNAIKSHLAICTRLPRCFPDEQDTSIISVGGLSSDCSQEEEKVGVWRAMARDPKINKDKNTQYLLFQESLLKNDYRTDVHVAGAWVITSLKTSVETRWF